MSAQCWCYSCAGAVVTRATFRNHGRKTKPDEPIRRETLVPCCYIYGQPTSTHIQSGMFIISCNCCTEIVTAFRSNQRPEKIKELRYALMMYVHKYLLFCLTLTSLCFSVLLTGTARTCLTGYSLLLLNSTIIVNITITSNTRSNSNSITSNNTSNNNLVLLLILLLLLLLLLLVL